MVTASVLPSMASPLTARICRPPWYWWPLRLSWCHIASSMVLISDVSMGLSWFIHPQTASRSR
ncbi:hypothetical protein BFG51_04545 [Dietzia alimentaria]|nr:hypothetical protein BFG51_04545 [Dietzia alimentaria]